MGKYFSDTVDNAIEAIYYTYDKERAAACLQSLADASNAGDGDASYILSRCTSGPQYSWKYHPFQENDEVTEQLIRKSILQGSAMGVLGAMRCGMLTPEMEEAMPFATLKEAWNTVYEKAQAGCLFAMNMIGNTYFWLDVVRIEGKGPNDFPSKEAFGQWLRESELKCIPWFEKAFRGGMGFAGRNLYNLYNDGDDGTFPPDKAKALELAKLGAELGYPNWQEQYAILIEKEDGRAQEALDLYFAAAKQGQLNAWYNVGKAFMEGKIVPKDCPRAMECFELGLEDPNAIGCANLAGKLLYLGQDGVPQDYGRAVQLFERAHALKNTWGNDMLGSCYLFGYGCQKDPARALQLFQEVDYSTNLLNYGLGTIYTQGLSVPEDIKKGVEYFQKCRNYAPAQEALLNFKKTLFGKWVRR
ncbi:MAG: sel1 repeat family protein [Lawsonibacter sp.]|jgi:TPR repeat protein|uniref:tetratricopeptide repeat protein n=1 Tax=Lawsonibacter sp. JLR.KK007 TaxID=3114293 RepID=UPI00216D7490|nr:sel1 repeat family protein [Lawsonibacter sp.]